TFLSLLLGIPAYFLLIEVGLFVGITLLGTLLLAVVCGCTGPERWRSFWVCMAPLALAAAVIAVYALSLNWLPYSSQTTFTFLYGIIVTILIFPLTLGFFKLGLHGIHRFREMDVVEG
nr:hypothetical protein [Armatimonadota bacterium]